MLVEGHNLFKEICLNMREVSGYLELAALNLEISVADLKDTEDEFATVAAKLEYCLELIKELRKYECFSYKGQHSDIRECVKLYNN